MSDITANVSVYNPRPIFTDSRTLRAVANGRIYIGEIDTDPTIPSNQIPVFVESESGEKIPIAQPLIINAAGKIVYNGQLVNVVTAQGYSMAIYDQFGSLVDLIPNVLKYDPAQFISRLAQSDGLKLIGACESIDELRTVSVDANGQLIFLRSWSTGKNIGSGIFQWNSTSVRPDDGGCVIQVTGITTGRWLRTGVIDKTPEMFGAIGDGVTDDTSALQRMFASANNYAVLADNFFGTFKMRNKYLVSSRISCGRPIKVDAYGAEFVVTGNFIAIDFSMHNGVWEGGYFNHMNIANSVITEDSGSMLLAPETNPVQVMNSVIRGVRSWGSHTPIRFVSTTTAIWQVELSNLELAVRSGSSTLKARPVLLNGTGGAGGNTTVTLNKVQVHGKGNEPGAGMKGYIFNGINEVSMLGCSYDWFEVAPGVSRTVGEKAIIDATCFRVNVIDFHTEQLDNTTTPFSHSPIYFNTNSLNVDGVEMLKTKSSGGGAWISPAGNGVFTFGGWHDLPDEGQSKGKVLDLTFWNTSHDTNSIISCTGNVLPSEFIGSNTRNNIRFAAVDSVFRVESDVQVSSGGEIINLGTDRQAVIVSVLGERVGSADMSFFSQVLCLRNNVGGWTIAPTPPTAKSTNFNAAVMNYGIIGNSLVFLISGDSNIYRIQCKTHDPRASVASYF